MGWDCLTSRSHRSPVEGLPLHLAHSESREQTVRRVVYSSLTQVGQYLPGDVLPWFLAVHGDGLTGQGETPCRDKEKKQLFSWTQEFLQSRAVCFVSSHRWYKTNPTVLESNYCPYLVFCAGQLALQSSPGSLQRSWSLGRLLNSLASRGGLILRDIWHFLFLLALQHRHTWCLRC